MSKRCCRRWEGDVEALLIQALLAARSVQLLDLRVPADCAPLTQPPLWGERLSQRSLRVTTHEHRINAALAELAHAPAVDLRPIPTLAVTPTAEPLAVRDSDGAFTRERRDTGGVR